MSIKKITYGLLLALALTGCSTPQVGYFKDVQTGEVAELTAPKSITIQPGDKLSILVSSKNPELAYLYNLPIVGYYRASKSDQPISTSQVAAYSVDENGDIDFPFLGKLHIAGMTRSQVAKFVREQLVKNNQIKDATVTVNFLDLYYSVMGEVQKPGRFVIDNDRVTLIDALSRAGDLTINGRRDNVLVMREEKGKQVAYRVDLGDAKTLYGSPVFYLRQNDVVYVDPTDKRAREATTVGNTFSQPTFWLSIVSLLLSIAIFIKK